MKKENLEWTSEMKLNLLIFIAALVCSAMVGCGSAKIAVGEQSGWYIPTAASFSVLYYSLISAGLRAWEKVQKK